jgi:hypothetical protein
MPSSTGDTKPNPLSMDTTLNSVLAEYHLICPLHIPNFTKPEHKYHPQCAHRQLPAPALRLIFILGRGANERKNSPYAKRANKISSNIYMDVIYSKHQDSQKMPRSCGCATEISFLKLGPQYESHSGVVFLLRFIFSPLALYS